MEKLGVQSTLPVISLKLGKIERKLLLTSYTKSYMSVVSVSAKMYDLE